MIEIVTRHREALARLCAQFRVRRLELFGSASAGDFDAAAIDLVFLVDYLPLPSGERSEAYFGLLEGLEDLFQRPIDLVMGSAIRNPYFIEGIAATRTTIYAA